MPRSTDMPAITVTITRKHLAQEVAEQLGLPIGQAEQAVDAVCEVIAESLQAGLRVEIRGLFSLHTVQSRERTGRNPKTGQVFPIPARRKVRAKFHVALAAHPAEAVATPGV